MSTDAHLDDAGGNGQEAGALPEVSTGADPGLGEAEEGAGAPVATAPAPEPEVEEDPAEVICALCSEVIEAGSGHLNTPYGPVHEPGCSSRAKRITQWPDKDRLV